MTTTTTTLDRSQSLDARSLKDLRGYRVMAADGEVGKVDDFYFDDVTWTLRYFVVNTGSWLKVRQVLVSPAAFTASDGEKKVIATGLTRDEIKRAPTADLDQPVSRQYEIELHQHYAWPWYWHTAPAVLQGRGADPHLRSFAEVLGYGIRATDGEIGHVEDMIAEEGSWIIRYLAIDTRNWLPGRKVIVSPMWVKTIMWSDKHVVVDMTRDQIEKSPEYDPAQPINRKYEQRLHDYYGRPVYWL